jgi:signal transduction histidine kinase
MVYYVTTRSQIDNAILALKKDITVQLSTNQEKWRAWKYLNLDSTLNAELISFAKTHSLNSLTIKQRTQINTLSDNSQIILPEVSNPSNSDLAGSELVVVASIDTSEIYKHFSTHDSIYYFLVSILIIFILLILLSGFYLYKNFYLPIWSVLRKIQNSNVTHSIDLTSIKANGELKDFIIFLNEFFKKYGLLERQSAIVEIASQVSHDIRSPIAALNLMTNQLSMIPEDNRIIIRSAVNRINDIANQLLQKSKESQLKSEITPKNNNNLNQLNIHLLSPVIDGIVSEKRIQFREKQAVSIECDIENAYGLFAQIDVSELKRVLSNLISNAVEALPEDCGKVIISLNQLNGKSIIQVSDNGRGIPEDIKVNLGIKGFSYGKNSTQSGNGLGLYHAKKVMNEASGELHVISAEGKGTSIQLLLNKFPAPKWFVEKITISPNTKIISIDDDISVHQIWKGRFNSPELVENKLNHLTFTSALDFKNWFNIQNINSNFIFLVDYEFLNQNTTGLDIIEELNIGAHSILVTSRYEETHIRTRCEKLGVKLIPKAMAAYVPLVFEKSKTQYDGILIDDDELIHSFWNLDAELKNKEILGFKTAEEFFNKISEIDFETKIYIDSNLGDNQKGEIISEKIYNFGFKNIYLCTGYDPSEFPKMPWLKGIIGKNSPF